ncbi:MAG: hypothetical protein DMF30_10220, partial [Verrucomicrobia bacterium]
GDDFKVECPTRSGNFLTLNEIANELSNRLIKIWLRGKNGERPFERASGNSPNGAQDRQWSPPEPSNMDGKPERASSPRRANQRYLFHEYFHGDTGAGLGASHQTGWTGLVAKLIQQQGEFGTIAKSS